MSTAYPKKGDLVSYHASQLQILGPCQGALGVIIDGPDKHGRMAVRWLKSSQLDKLFVWNSVDCLRIESRSTRPRVEPSPGGYESAAFLEPAEGEEFKNDDIF